LLGLHPSKNLSDALQLYEFVSHPLRQQDFCSIRREDDQMARARVLFVVEATPGYDFASIF